MNPADMSVFEPDTSPPTLPLEKQTVIINELLSRTG